MCSSLSSIISVSHFLLIYFFPTSLSLLLSLHVSFLPPSSTPTSLLSPPLSLPPLSPVYIFPPSSPVYLFPLSSPVYFFTPSSPVCFFPPSYPVCFFSPSSPVCFFPPSYPVCFFSPSSPVCFFPPSSPVYFFPPSFPLYFVPPSSPLYFFPPSSPVYFIRTFSPALLFPLRLHLPVPSAFSTVSYLYLLTIIRLTSLLSISSFRRNLQWQKLVCILLAQSQNVEIKKTKIIQTL
jgi:hypothetical protein